MDNNTKHEGEGEDEGEIKQRSLEIHYAAELRRKYHQRRLDNLLDSNELIGVPT